MTARNGTSAKIGATKMAAAVLVGGLVAGGLLAMSTPTRMNQQTENWRDMIGVRKVAVQDGTIPVYAAPEDLTPVHWQSAAQEYPSMPPQDAWMDASADVMPDLIPDTGDDYQPEAQVEALPAEMMQARTSLAARDDADAAASSAEAARAAAADVRAQENAAADPATTESPVQAAPQAVTAAT